jgi:hypothetical protein
MLHFISLHFKAIHTERLNGVWLRVARWFVLKPKIPIWVNIGGPKIGKCLNIFWPFGIFYKHLGFFMTIWYICVQFVHYVIPVLVSCTEKNQASLVWLAFIQVKEKVTSTETFCIPSLETNVNFELRTVE